MKPTDSCIFSLKLPASAPLQPLIISMNFAGGKAVVKCHATGMMRVASCNSVQRVVQWSSGSVVQVQYQWKSVSPAFRITLLAKHGARSAVTKTLIYSCWLLGSQPRSQTKEPTLNDTRAKGEG